MKIKKYIVLILIFTSLTASYYLFLIWRSKNITINPNDTIIPNKKEMLKYAKISCAQNKGNWLQEHTECENISEDTCNKLGGEFEPCASACRHNPKAQACIEICVPVCIFNYEKS